MKIKVINGPNLNLLGARDKNQYGAITLPSLQDILSTEFAQHKFEFFQSNIEGEIIDAIQSSAKSFDALIINPGGYSHTSVAIRDALEDSKIPSIEVHLSNLAKREDFRSQLITASSAIGYISGFKELSYSAAVFILEKLVSQSK